MRRVAPKRRKVSPPARRVGAQQEKRLRSLAREARAVSKSAYVVKVTPSNDKLFQQLRRTRKIVVVGAPVRFVGGPRGRPKSAPTSRVFTYYKAQGVAKNFKRGYERSDPPVGMVSGPGAFFSQEPLFLGQVKFEGRVALAQLEAMLDNALDVRTSRGRLVSFKVAYDFWRFKYQVVSITDGKRRVLKTIRGGKGRSF